MSVKPSKDNFIDHFTSSDRHTLWNKNGFSFWLRLRGIAVSFLISLSAGGIITWGMWLNKIFIYYVISPFIIFMSIAIIIPFGLSSGLFIARSLLIKKLNLNEKLHNTVHMLRDNITDSRELSYTGLTEEAITALFYKYCDEIATLIADFHREMLGDSTINCAIRVAIYNKVKNSLTYYSVGISNGFNPNRKKKRAEIPADSGLPQYFSRQCNSKGVLVIHNIEKAVKKGVYHYTENDTAYPEDYKTIMIAPINGLDIDGNSALLGLLHLTSKKDPFCQDYVDDICAFADVIAIGVPQLVEYLFEGLIIHKQLVAFKQKDEQQKPNIDSFGGKTHGEEQPVDPEQND